MAKECEDCRKLRELLQQAMNSTRTGMFRTMEALKEAQADLKTIGRRMRRIPVPGAESPAASEADLSPLEPLRREAEEKRKERMDRVMRGDR